MWEVVKGELLDLLVFLVTSLVSVGVAYGIAYLRRARAEIEARIDNEVAESLLGRIWHLVEVGIWTTESETARALREAVAEGKTSREELVKLGRDLVDEVLSKLDDEARVALAATVGDVRGYVEEIVEAELERLKGKGVIPRVKDLADPKSQPA